MRVLKHTDLNIYKNSHRLRLRCQWSGSGCDVSAEQPSPQLFHLWPAFSRYTLRLRRSTKQEIISEFDSMSKNCFSHSVVFITIDETVSRTMMMRSSSHVRNFNTGS